MMYSNVDRNQPGYRTRWKIEVKKKKFENHSKRPKTQLTDFTERQNGENYQWDTTEMFQNCKIEISRFKGTAKAQENNEEDDGDEALSTLS